MKKLVVIAIILAFGLVPVLAGTAQAEKKHAAKPVWQGMIANLSDVQGIMAALMVFDMARVASISDQLAAREKYVATLDFLPEVVRNRHSKIGDMAGEMATAARAGDDLARIIHDGHRI
ncbi:MAG: hypothetical protein O3B21_10935 [Proteobacteria bacterium]|nr:hypothetical protein [Pseudomonadota bacterium]MDA1357573.1 hypothetical protein [Pseudomonadota bacterium]